MRFVRTRLPAIVPAALLVAALGPPLPAAADAPLPVPVPEVDGPLPGSPPGDPVSDDIAETYPFFSTTEDLERYGYVEEEYLLSGEASLFDGGRAVSEHPYRTRVVVRRPADGAGSGTALMEWQNVTAGYDLDALWGPSAEHIMRSGHTWVGVSAQHVGVSHLTGWSPARYGDLDVTDGGEVGDDQLSYDVFSQAAQGLKAGLLTGGQGPDRVLAIGASQSAGRMTDYYERVLPAIEPVIDGYGFMVGTAPETERSEPVFQVLSETDVLLAGGDGGDGGDRVNFRSWQVAGTAHSPWHGHRAREEAGDRDLGGVPQYDCASPPYSRIPLYQVMNAAYEHLDSWAVGGSPPPEADPIERTSSGRVARDEDGMALGGIRTSQVDVPTAVSTGVNAPADGDPGGDDAFCVLFGSHEPFSEEELDDRYRTHAGYVARVVRTERGLVRDGFVLPVDSFQNRWDAVRSDVGR
ncbi:alpha/beta hydrolase domain-containing protein [Nocardiopsis baichengensis]|uniref:alpha/beta hydrolase domain-containing protein n=1 Tax=Nocardiopsis baichengensis TaxID=280240 RepID=UPI000349FE34|nr:alpha/beta hydrolase domain-containing protein [Nocardiopsis baichengensis]